MAQVRRQHGRLPGAPACSTWWARSGMALGQASLTVEEQANTFAMLSDRRRVRHPARDRKITSPTGPVPLRIARYQVLSPGEAADVDYALSFDTQPGGTGYPNATMADGRPVIAKTGTTNNAQSAFFIGAIPQYSLAVGIFTNKREPDAQRSRRAEPGRVRRYLAGADLAHVRGEGVREAADQAASDRAVRRHQVGPGSAAASASPQAGTEPDVPPEPGAHPDAQSFLQPVLRPAMPVADAHAGWPRARAVAYLYSRARPGVPPGPGRLAGHPGQRGRLAGQSGDLRARRPAARARRPAARGASGCRPPGPASRRSPAPRRPGRRRG